MSKTKKAAKKKKYAVPMKVVHLVHRIQKHILEEPKRFDMNTLVDRFKVNRETLQDSHLKHVVEEELKELPQCNTVACIAGWTVLLVKPNLKWNPFQANWNNHLLRSRPKADIEKIAAKELHLGAEEEIWDEDKGEYLPPERATEETMFFVENWPEPYGSKYSDADQDGDKRKCAKIAVQRLNYYLRTGK